MPRRVKGQRPPHLKRTYSNGCYESMIVSIPIDLSGPGDEKLAKLEAHGVRGRYASVETFVELENGNTEWRMATSSTPGGSIPSFIVESTMAGKIAQVC